MQACTLGCPETRVYITDFCGRGVLCDVTDSVTFLRWGRELDDDSEVELTLHLSGSENAACCACVGQVRTWRNEIMLVRGGEVVWGPGPVVTIEIQRHVAHLVARDVVAWLDRRLVHLQYEFSDADLGTIAQTVVEDALLLGKASEIPIKDRDACILEHAQFSETGKYTDMEILPNRRTAGEVLRELADEGLDFTVVARKLIVGADFAFGPVGPLRDGDFGEDLKVSERGLAAATGWAVSSDQRQAYCGGADPFFGLVERGVEGQPAAVDADHLSVAACDRLASSNPPPLIVTVPSEGQILPHAPVCPAVLVPGTLVDLDISGMCRQAQVRERLTAVTFRLDDKGERVGVTLAPLHNIGGAEGEETE